MTEHYSPMSITQRVHSNEDQTLLTEVLHYQTHSSATTAPEGGVDNKHNTTLPPLSMDSTSTTSPLLAPSSCLSDPQHLSSSSDASSTCLEKASFHSRLVSTETTVVAQNGPDSAELYGKRTCTSLSSNDSEDKETMAATHALACTSLVDELDGEDGQHIRQRTSRMDNEGTRTPRSRPHSPHHSYISHHQSVQPRQSPSKSIQTRWQQLVIQAGSAAGTTAAVVSEESMKCLRYCLHWLQYATQHIQQQMHLLRLYLVSLATSSTTRTVSPSNQQPSSPSLSSIQHEIILTLRKVVEVVSQYAGTGLPTHAKASIRSFILQLPGKWATMNNSSTDSSGPNDVPDHVKETSIKLLNFGGESLEMLESVSSVFSDSIDRAQLWLDRLRSVGVVPPASTTRTHTEVMES